jgi:HK97 family phage portal protein
MGGSKALTLPPVLYNNTDTYLPYNPLRSIGEGVVLYPEEIGDTYINKGYKKNAIVFSIVSKCAKKFAQVPWYHYRINPKERKTWLEYEDLTRKGLTADNVKEARKMRQKALQEVVVNSPISKALAKPNRNQNDAAYLEQIYTYKLLTGEGNTWYTRDVDSKGNPLDKGPIREQLIIPKGNLQLIKGGDPWDIASYQITISGKTYAVPKSNMNMWICNNPVDTIDGMNLSHLRGLSPLKAGLLELQATNEGGERLVNMNKNQGAAGFAYRKDLAGLSADQTMVMRQQFDSIVNNSYMSGKYAVLGGEWGVHQLGLSVDDLKLIEQMDNAAKWLCGIFDYPFGLFDGNQTYDNKLQDKRNLIWDNIAPACYSFRDERNEELLPAYGLDRERDVIDCDVTSLPELAQDLKTQIEAMQKADFLTIDEKREAAGYPKLNTPEANTIFLSSSVQNLANAAMPIGEDLQDL